MKRNLFAIALALMLVVALVFVVAPTAKAETVTLTDGATLNITKDTVLDLAGNSGTVNVAEGVKLSVYDSANTGVTGEGAGKLTVNGNVEIEATDAAGRRFLAVPNDDGTSYSFHPFFVGIEKVGVNTNKTALCLKAIFVANEVAQKKISTGMFYGATPDDLPKAADTYGAFSFVDGVMEAYFDLAGSLDSQEAIDASRSFQAYIKVGEEAVTNKVYTVTPSYVISELDKIASEFNDTLKAKMVNMITGKAHLEALCPNFLGVTSEPETEPAYVKVTSVDEVTSGKYVMVLSTGHAPTVLSGTWVLVGKPTVGADGAIAVNNAEGFIWDLTVDGNSVKIKDANGTHIAPSGGNTNGIKSGEYSWAWEMDANGGVTFKGTGSDTTTLCANSGSSYQLRAYKNTTVSGNPTGYPSLFTLYKLSDGATTPDVPDVTEPPVTEPPVTEPAADSLLTIEQANALGLSKEHNSYTSDKYYVEGEITEVSNTTYGNIYIEDNAGNKFYIYGLYVNGKSGIRYDAMKTKPVVGDTIKVYGIIGQYNGSAQMKDAEFIHDHVNESVVTAPTCTTGGYTTSTCSICGYSTKDNETPALGHTTDNGECGNCGQTIGGDTPAEPTNVTVSIKDYASANGWKDATKYSSLVMDENITVSASTSGNNGKYYTSGTNWRMYQSDNGTVTVTANNGKTIKSVKLTYTNSNNGYLNYNGTKITSGTTFEVNASSITFNVLTTTAGKTNGQARITAIEVVYE